MSILFHWVRARVGTVAVAVAVGCMAASAAAVAQEGTDWPQFLGPTANGVSTETGLVEKWPSTGPVVIWNHAVGTGYSAPSVRGDLLVLHHRVGNQEVIQAFHAATGKPVWEHGYRSDFVDPYGYNNGPRCSPLLTADRCYTFGAEGRIVCLELKTGRKIWERETEKEWKIPPAFFGVGSSPILEGNRLLVMVGGQPNAGMVAFDAATGSNLWESVGATNWQGQTMVGWPGEPLVQWRDYEKQASYATPVAATIHGRRQVFCLMRQGLVSVDPTNGQVNFSRWFRSRANDSVNAANPVVVDDLVFCSAAYFKVGSFVLQVAPDGRSFKELWRSPVLEIHWTTPIYHNGYLFAFSGRNEPDARFRCVEMKTGKLMWDRDESWPAHSAKQPPVYGRGSAIMADGKLIVLGEGGLLGMFKVDSARDREVCRYQVPELHYPCWAAPILSRKRLYLRSEDRLMCFDLAAVR